MKKLLKKNVVWLTFSFLFLATAFAFAQDAAVGAENVLGGFESWKGLIKGLGAGAIAGISVAFLGFMKSTEKDKKFDLKYASSTLLVGALVGAIAGFQKKDLTKPEDWYHAGTAVLLAELIMKAVWRNTAPKIGEVVATLTGKKTGGDETK